MRAKKSILKKLNHLKERRERQIQMRIVPFNTLFISCMLCKSECIILGIV